MKIKDKNNKLISIDRVDHYIEKHVTHEVAIIGVEGFFVRENKRIPDPNSIIDLSTIHADNWEEYRRKSIDAVKKFFFEQDESQSGNKRYEFCLISLKDFLDRQKLS